MANILQVVTNEEDGMAAVVAQINSGFSVALKDLDSGLFVDSVRIFKTFEAAVAYAQGVTI